MEAAELRFPGGDTFIHIPTVELAGKPSLFNYVVVVSKDQMNYLSQDASRSQRRFAAEPRSSWEMKSKLP